MIRESKLELLYDLLKKYLIFYYIKSRNSGMSKVKIVKIERKPAIINPINVFKFQKDRESKLELLYDMLKYTPFFNI